MKSNLCDLVDQEQHSDAVIIWPRQSYACLEVEKSSLCDLVDREQHYNPAITWPRQILYTSLVRNVFAAPWSTVSRIANAFRIPLACRESRDVCS